MSLVTWGSVSRPHVDVLKQVIPLEINPVDQRQPRLLGMGAILNAEDEVQNPERLEPVLARLEVYDLPGSGHGQEIVRTRLVSSPCIIVSCHLTFPR